MVWVILQSMEEYSIEDLFNDLDDDEVEDDEESETKKKIKLAKGILDFFKSKSEKNLDNEAIEIIGSLFEKFKPDIDETDLNDPDITENESIEIARNIVDQRIDELTQSISESPKTESVDKNESKQKLELLQQMNEVLVSETLESNDEFASIDETTIDGPPRLIHAEATVLNHPNTKTEKKIPESHTQPTKHIDHTKTVSSSHSQAKTESIKPGVVSANYRTENIHQNETLNNIEKDIHPKFREIRNIEHAPKVVELDEPSELDTTRALIENLYHQEKSSPTATEHHPETKNPIHELNKYQYLDISKKIFLGNESLNRYFDKNHVPEIKRIKIIREILKGKNPEKVITKILKTRSTIDRSAESHYREPTKHNQSFDETRLNESKAEINNILKPSAISLFGPLTWAMLVIIVIIIIVLVILIA
jgi:hypothetical protein